jgi:hypothetical protein
MCVVFTRLICSVYSVDLSVPCCPRFGELSVFINHVCPSRGESDFRGVILCLCLVRVGFRLHLMKCVGTSTSFLISRRLLLLVRKRSEYPSL